jgi:hypothetical protein
MRVNVCNIDQHTIYYPGHYRPACGAVANFTMLPRDAGKICQLTEYACSIFAQWGAGNLISASFPLYIYE